MYAPHSILLSLGGNLVDATYLLLFCSHASPLRGQYSALHIADLSYVQYGIHRINFKWETRRIESRSVLVTIRCALLLRMSNFVKQTSFQVDYAPAYITKWRSQRTGLQVTYIDQPSPIVNGYFAVATEIENDSGAPHTLEHLVFMGSEKFPYKGLLDTLGNRLYSSTNAWTSVDQTVYTLTTAGWDGFKTLLPIYLDHLFFPTLTDEACVTEVYHIDGKGKEKGVVFSEMQGIEAQSWFQTFLGMQRLLYPELLGYSSETGGLMSELRHLTNDQIKQFHKAMYRPDNLCVIITGSIDKDELLEIMSLFDNELQPLGELPRPRPFVDSKPVDAVAETTIKEIEFPDDDESMGETILSWIGPPASDTITNCALDILGAYFCDSPISILTKNLIETENPLATDIDYSTDDYLRTTINFTTSGVPTEKLAVLDARIKELISSQATPQNFDLAYVRQLIEQHRLKFVSRTEKSASTFSNIAISEFIYGNVDGSDLSKWTKSLDEFDALLKWDAQQWSSLIKLQLVDNPSVSVLGRPSRKLNESYKLNNKKIARGIKEQYGPEGLAQLQQKLDAAQEMNDRPIPEQLLTQFDRPDPSKIAFINTRSYTAGSLGSLVETAHSDYTLDDQISERLRNDAPERGDLPMFMHFENFKSQFTTISLVVSSTKIDESLLKYMSIIEEIFTMSLQLPDRYIPFSDVISELNNDLIEFQLDNGYENQFLELINIKVKFESRKYHQAIGWLQSVMRFAVFEESRIKIIIEKIVNSLPDKKRNGELMMYSCQYRNMFNGRSLRKAQDAINTETFFKDLLDELNHNPDAFKRVKDDLEKLVAQLFGLDNIKAFVLGDIEHLDSPISAWVPFVNSFEKPNSDPIPFASLPRSHEFLSDAGRQCRNSAFLVSSPAAESTHLITSTAMPTDYMDEDIFKIALATEFLTAVEGPFWRGIRGTGLAYGASIRRNVETGYLSFSLYRAADPKQAFLTAQKIVGEYANGALPIDDVSIENAIAAIINELANGEDNSYDAATCRISDNIFKRRGPQYTKLYLNKLNQLLTDDVKNVLQKYFVGLFDPAKSIIFSSIPSSNTQDMTEFVESLGYTAIIEEVNAEAGDPEDHDDCLSCDMDDSTDASSDGEKDSSCSDDESDAEESD